MTSVVSVRSGGKSSLSNKSIKYLIFNLILTDVDVDANFLCDVISVVSFMLQKKLPKEESCIFSAQ